MQSPEMQPQVSEYPTKAGEGLRQKESITLPEGQTITVRGKQQKRFLSLLITAFNQGTHVPSEDLLGFDLAKGILPNPMQRQTLSRALRTLRQNTLTGTGWDIQSITVTGKGVERRPKGYILKKENAQKADAPTSYLQSILENKIFLKEVVTGGPGKTSILEQAQQQINSLDPQQKIIFLEETFAILSDPDPKHQDKRDAASELLNIMDLKSIDPKELVKTYIKAVSNLLEGLNQDSDPYGEIDALLQAGKTIASFIENSQGKITRLWNRVANTFIGGDRQKILDDIKEIKQLTLKTLSEFDAKVLMLVEKGQRNEGIAAELGVEIPDIQRSISRLRKGGIKLQSFNRGKGMMRTQQQTQLFEDVKDLRSRGMGNLEIASELTTPQKNITQKKINTITHELIRKGEIPSLYKSRKKA